MADPSPALQARVEQLRKELRRWFLGDDGFMHELAEGEHPGQGYVGLPAVEALVIRLLTEQQLQEEEIQRLQARVEPLKAGGDGQDLPRNNNQPSPLLPSGRNDEC